MEREFLKLLNNDRLQMLALVMLIDALPRKSDDLKALMLEMNDRITLKILKKCD